ncbi:hypothetical protein SK128_004386 [Halocaridina rubra]|uniref:Uncharacterized protein n=1 Tax=Halocaridina rubra TaxID=373956 RepID=A0AAN8ZVU5_HALRR
MNDKVLLFHLLVIDCLTTLDVRGDHDLSQVAQTMDDDGYMFEYSVVGSDSSWMQSHGEWSDGISTHGSYNVKLPDGRIQTVVYTADERGFRPVVSYEIPKENMDYGLKNHINTETMADSGEIRDKKALTSHYGKKLDGMGVQKNIETRKSIEKFLSHHSTPYYDVAKYYEAPANKFIPKHNAPDSYNSNEPHEKVADDHRSASPRYEFSPAPIVSSYKKKFSPIYHTANPYRIDVTGYRKHRLGGKSIQGKYQYRRAKTYYMDKDMDRDDFSETSESMNGKENKRPYEEKQMKKLYSTRKQLKEESGARLSGDNIIKEDDTIKRFSSKLLDMSPSDEENVMSDESGTESNEEESSEENENKPDQENGKYDEKSEGENPEEKGDEEKSSYITLMTTLMPPSKPYVPPTYFPPSPSPNTSLVMGGNSSYWRNVFSQR